MKRIFKRSSALLLTVPAALLIILAIGCGPSEPAPATEPVIVDTLSAPTDTLPPIDTTAGDKPPVPVTKS